MNHTSNHHVLWRLLKLARPHAGWMALGAFLTLITALASIGLLAVSGWFLASMAAAGIAGVTMNYFTPAGVIRFLAIVRTAGRYAERLVTHNATLKLLAELRLWFYNRLEPLAPAGLQGLHSGELLSRIQADIDRLDNLYLRILVPFIVALVGVPLLIWLISRYDPTLAMISLVGLLGVALLIPLWSHYANRTPGQQQVQQSAALRAAQMDAVAGLKELLIYGAAERHSKHCQRLSDQLMASQQASDRVNAASQALSLLLINLTVVAALWLLIPQVASDSRPPVELAMLALLILSGFELALPMPLALEQLAPTLESARRLFQLADQQPPRPEPEQPVEPGRFESLQCRQLSFSYPGRQQAALQHFDLTLQAGEKIALIGPSGAGKSTLINLLSGFWPTAENALLVNGIDINHIKGDALRSQIAVVSQQPHLFAASLAENLRMANPAADRTMMEHACQQAGLGDFLAELPEGLNTPLGEYGQGLSGGQARRLAIARALLKDAPILILDEPTEGLDPQTEQALMKTLQPIMAKRTVILISHRPAMLSLMDRICVLDEGRIRAKGSHSELLAESEYYRNLLRLF